MTVWYHESLSYAGDEVFVRALVDCVDCAIAGSEYAVEAWEEFKRLLVTNRSPNLTQWNKLANLVDMARDDVKGPRMRVDLELERIY